MDSAIYIRELSKYCGRNLANYNYRFGESNFNGIDEAFEKLRQFFPAEIRYLYFGTEFCEHLIPEEEEIRKWKKICECDNLVPVFVTPMVSDWGLNRLKMCFDLISTELQEAEIVVNDYGVAELIRSSYPGLKIIFGRMLDKLTHESRALANEFEDYYGVKGIQYAVHPGNVSGYSQRAISIFQVKRFEYDLPNVGILLPPNSFHYSLYWPFSFLTTGRVCMFHSFEEEGVNRFLAGYHSCRKICRTTDLVLRKPLNGFRTKDGKFTNELNLFQKGNTIFYLADNRATIQSLPQFDRIVIELM